MSSTGDKPELIPTRYSLLSRLHDWDDQESWRSFFDIYWRLIFNIALKSGLTEAEAQDVVQETVICVAKDIDKFRPKPELGSFKGWLRNIVRWRVVDQLRARKRSPAGTQQDGAEASGLVEEPPGDSPLERAWEQEWQENLLAAAVSRAKARVREEHFQVFDLLVLQGTPLPEVMQRLGVSRAAVYLIKHRVSKIVKKELAALEKSFV
jgi:RNA polymerase sigma-70 factor (ECF subfamily)